MKPFSPTSDLSQTQRDSLAHYAVLLREWNQKINLVSRSDEARIESYHIPHSLMLGYRAFPEGATIVDWGTGGGLPALALAVRFPGSRIIAVDRVGKKIAAVRSMAAELGLKNLEAIQCDALGYDGPCDFAVSRATAPAIDLVRWTLRARARNARPADDVASPGPAPPPQPGGLWLPGLICLKGGDLSAEMDRVRARYPQMGIETVAIDGTTGDDAWSDKHIVHIAEGLP